MMYLLLFLSVFLFQSSVVYPFTCEINDCGEYCIEAAVYGMGGQYGGIGGPIPIALVDSDFDWTSVINSQGLANVMAVYHCDESGCVNGYLTDLTCTLDSCHGNNMLNVILGNLLSFLKSIDIRCVSSKHPSALTRNSLITTNSSRGKPITGVDPGYRGFMDQPDIYIYNLVGADVSSDCQALAHIGQFRNSPIVIVYPRGLPSNGQYHPLAQLTDTLFDYGKLVVTAQGNLWKFNQTCIPADGYATVSATVRRLDEVEYPNVVEGGVHWDQERQKPDLEGYTCVCASDGQLDEVGLGCGSSDGAAMIGSVAALMWSFVEINFQIGGLPAGWVPYGVWAAGIAAAVDWNASATYRRGAGKVVIPNYAVTEFGGGTWNYSVGVTPLMLLKDYTLYEDFGGTVTVGSFVRWTNESQTPYRIFLYYEHPYDHSYLSFAYSSMSPRSPWQKIPPLTLTIPTRYFARIEAIDNTAVIQPGAVVAIFQVTGEEMASHSSTVTPTIASFVMICYLLWHFE